MDGMQVIDWDLAVATGTRLVRPGPQVSREEARRAVAADGLFVANIARPKGFFPWIEDIQATRDVIERFNARAGSVRGPTR